MAPKRISFPSEGGIYRGDPWRFYCDFDFDVSTAVFTLDLAPALNLSAEQTINVTDRDDTHQADETPYVRFVLSAEATSAIDVSVTSLELELTDTTSGETFLTGSVPVAGQIGQS